MGIQAHETQEPYMGNAWVFNVCSLMMTDEALFHLNGFVNKQNFRYWKLENSRIVNEKELHPQRIIVRPQLCAHTSLKTQKALQRQSTEKDIETCSIHS